MGGGNSLRKRKLPEKDTQTPSTSSQRSNLNASNESKNKRLKRQSCEEQFSSIQQTVGCVPHASNNAISASKTPHLPACPREDFLTFTPQRINFSRNNIFTGATNRTEAIDFQPTPVENNFQGNIAAMPSEFSYYYYNFEQHNETGAQLTSCRFSKQRRNDQNPGNAQCVSAFFYGSEGSLARNTNPVYNNGMFVKQNHLQYTREGVAHEQQPLVTPYQSGQSIHPYSPDFPDVANPMSSCNYGC